MFTRLLTRRMRNRASRLFELCELVCPDSSSLAIQPRVRTLRVRDMLDIIAALDERELGRLKYVAFDFSCVEELDGPWGVHFALLINLSKRLKGRVIVTSLRGQPAKVARLFRKSSDILALCFSLDDEEAPEVNALVFGAE